MLLLKFKTNLNIYMKQCTRLQYTGITNRLIDNQQSGQIVYDIVFATPVKVNVKEEYLIYDGVTMISARQGRRTDRIVAC